MKKDRLNVYFDPSLSAELDAMAVRRKVSKSQIVEAALAAFLSPDGADQREAAIVRRLDRLTRSVERLERDQSIGNEAVALFVKFWLTTTPPLPESMRDAAKASGKDRYDGFVEALGRRLAKGKMLTKEVSEDRKAAGSS
ncbi:ribbon-helix-helix protein, CopG family [Rhodophyticola sp. CCM32]|uniref:ribbon-helix-helix domain-containing protein n=1 Tax=Rhodophyticola sp. CCM32 TaxID=2916397 RepID=UPI00107F2291|nr:CopG family transcriptional regulator [Rhodophyticola sp. CCM32]QBY00439.1 ribbon-helix-helix protein, CopG family [Rhodophyticola sp. CCM32]